MFDNVRILHPCFSYQNLVYKIKLDVSRFREVSWKASNSMKLGSLVCVSADHFETVFIAVLAKRDIEELKEGVVYVCFDTDTLFHSSWDVKNVYEMVVNPTCHVDVETNPGRIAVH